MISANLTVLVAEALFLCAEILLFSECILIVNAEVLVSFANEVLL